MTIIHHYHHKCSTYISDDDRLKFQLKDEDKERAERKELIELRSIYNMDNLNSQQEERFRFLRRKYKQPIILKELKKGILIDINLLAAPMVWIYRHLPKKVQNFIKKYFWYIACSVIIGCLIFVSFPDIINWISPPPPEPSIWMFWK